MSDSLSNASARSDPLWWTFRFAVATWVAAAGLVLIFALFWRMSYAPPHAAWAIATTGAVLLAGVLTAFTGIWQFVRGPRRLLTAAVVLLGTTSIVWGATFLASLYLQAVGRESISINAPTRMAMFWFASLADAEARWRYPRWTQGRHVVLLDDGQTPEPEKMVKQMDEHIEQMADRLGTSVPTEPARWVRGKLLGQGGRALYSWAVCDVGGEHGELTRLDKHEVAHVLMTMAGNSDQYPPMLFAEGWAESQSKDRAEMILNLAQQLERGTNYSLQELISPEWYGRSYGPVYNHGGPLVVYLMEHYGPEKFFSLYHGVRPETFSADSERILGDSWPVVEEQFWEWLAAEADQIAAAREEPEAVSSMTADDVQLAESVDPEHWQTIVAGYRAAWQNRPPMPDACAFAVERTETVPPGDPGRQPGTYEENNQGVIEGEDLWQRTSYLPAGFVYAWLAKSGPSAIYVVSPDGRITRTDLSKHYPSPQDNFRENWHQFANSADLGRYLPVDPQRYFPSSHLRITSIRPPDTPEDSLWGIDYLILRNPEDADEKRSPRRLRVDASADWCVVSDVDTEGIPRRESHNKLGKFFGRTTAVESTTRAESEKGLWTTQVRLRELEPVEVRAVREEVEAIARRGPTRDWRDLLLRPLTLAVAWPALGLLLLGVALVRDGCRIGTPHEG